MSYKSSHSLASEIMQARKPRINVALPPREDLPDDTVAARAREIGEKWGANTQLLPADAPAPAASESSPKRQMEMVSVRFDFPAYVDEQLAIKAASTRGPSGGKITKTYLALKALKDAGYHVEDEDLIEDRRRNRK